MTKRGLEDSLAELLKDWDDRLPWRHSVGSVTATEILRGSDETDLVVVAATSPRQPLKADLQGLWRARSKGGVTPVLVAVTYPDGDEELIALLGLTDDAVPVSALEHTLAEQLIREALRATSPSGLHTEMRRRLASLSGGVASGLRNEGLFASHVLELQPEQSTWVGLSASSGPLMGKRGEDLLEGLGYTVEAVPDGTVLRTAGEGHRRAAAVLLAAGESFENPLSRFHNSNAVMHGLALARREHLDWLVVLGGAVIRLYPVNPDVGVGRKGQTQTYVELDLSLLPAPRTGYLTLLFSPDALSDNGAITRLLRESSRFSTGLSERLRDRIYVDVIPTLAVAVADKMRVVDLPKGQQKDGLGEAYHQAMIILFRLLFVAYAEDRRLLPYEMSDQYTRNSLTRLALDLLKRPGQSFDVNSTTLWDDLTQVWKVIDTGDMDGWGVPAYNGGLFTRDTSKNPSGAATYVLDLTNDKIGPTLSALLIDISQDEVLGLVDFRSLSVREFGTIYEGLLESGLGVADTNLTLDKNETYVPAKASDEIKVHAGEVYFHSRSGARKATGSYFTKPFAVEHLLDSALEPAIDVHLDRVKGLMDGGATKSAGEALFDFRVTDLAMGSAHFLVAAIDRIEARFSAFLIENPLPEVAVELHRLRIVAATQLGLDSADSGIDDGQLLRRQIARRCIYGVDINEIAVELARLGIWIHTFVPGLPLSFLNHSLVWGNSLTGIGTIQEITQAFADAEIRELKKKPDASATLRDGVLGDFLDRAGEHLAALGALSDASVGDVAAAAKIQANIEGSLAPLSALCDLITAERVTRHLPNAQVTEIVYDRYGRNPKQVKRSTPNPDRVLLSASPSLFIAASATALETAILAHPDLRRARDIAATLMATHIPVRFPEVFRRDHPGFDCILGNPPWDKVRHEPQQFWVTRDPGLNAFSVDARNARIAYLRANKSDDAEEERREQQSRASLQMLAKHGYSLLGPGHYDFAKMFAERFVNLMRKGGSLGVVLPQAALMLSGWSALRERLIAESLVTAAECRNTGGWLFENVEPRTAVVLFSRVNLVKTSGVSPSIRILPGLLSRGAFDSRWDSAIVMATDEVTSLSETCALPWFNSPRDSGVFNVLRKYPTLGSGTSWIIGTSDSGRWDFSGSGAHHKYAEAASPDSGNWRVLKTRHVDAFCVTNDVFDKQVDPFDLVSLNRGVSVINGQAKLNESHPIITYRFPSRNDDSRTLIATALPDSGYLFSTGYAHGIKHPDGVQAKEILALLAFMNSFVADWWVRRFVDRHVGARIFNSLVLPDWNPKQIDEAAACSRDLLIASGVSTLPGGIKLSSIASGVPSNTEPRVWIDVLAAKGFGLTPDDVSVILTDFAETDAAVSIAHRQKVLAELADGQEIAL